MPLSFADAVQKVHTAIETKDESALAAHLSDLALGMSTNDLTDSAVHAGQRPLNYAARVGFAAGCELLLTGAGDHGSDANTADDGANTRGLLPMWFALQPDDAKDTEATIAVCRVLVQSGRANLEKTHVRNPPTPLEMVVGGSDGFWSVSAEAAGCAPGGGSVNIPVALALLELGASISSWAAYLHWQCGRTDLQAEELSRAVTLASGKIPAADAQRVTALHVLCANPLASAATITALKSVTEAVKSRQGTLPVTFLCRNPSVMPSSLDAVLAGLPRGVRVKDWTRRAGIHELCRNPSLTAELLKVALHYDPGAAAVSDNEGRVALHLICLRPGGPESEVLEVVLKANPDAVLKADSQGSLPLHLLLAKTDAPVKRALQLLAASSREQHNAMGVGDGGGRNPLQVALLGLSKTPVDLPPAAAALPSLKYSGVVGVESALPRLSAWSLLEALARAYPKDADPAVVYDICRSPHVNRTIVGTLVQNLKTEVVSVPEPSTGLLPLHVLLTRPLHSTLGLREPLDDGVMVDCANLLIDRYRTATVTPCGKLQRIPLHCLTATWRASREEAHPVVAGHGIGGAFYSATVASYAEFFGFAATELLRIRTLDNGAAPHEAVEAEDAAVDSANGVPEDLMIAAVANKIIEQVAGTMGRGCWDATDAEGMSPLDYCRRESLWQVERILAKAAGSAAERTLEQLCEAPDVGEPLPPPTPAAIRMMQWREAQLNKTEALVNTRPEMRSLGQTVMLELEGFENKLALQHGAEAIQYDSEDDFAEPGGFDMDISSAAGAVLTEGRPASRLELALTQGQLDDFYLESKGNTGGGATPVSGQPNILGILCANPKITDDALAALLRTSPTLALAGHWPHEDRVGGSQAAEWWPKPLHLLCWNVGLAAVSPETLGMLVDACPEALQQPAPVEPAPAGATDAGWLNPLQLLCYNPELSAELLRVLLSRLASQQDVVAVAGSVCDSPVGARGGGGGGKALEILCSNPFWTLRADTAVLPTFLEHCPDAARPGWPQYTAPAAAESVADDSLDGFEIDDPGTSLHRLCANIGASEALLVPLLNAAPEAAWLVNTHGCLPLHLLCANPSHALDQWALRRVLEMTPHAGLKWFTGSEHCRTCMHGLLGLAPDARRSETLLLEMVAELFAVCTDGNSGEAVSHVAWPQPGVAVLPPKFAFYAAKGGTALARWTPRAAERAVHWPQSWALHMGGALQLARTAGLNAIVDYLRSKQNFDEPDELAMLPLEAIFPSAKLYLDPGCNRPTPRGSTPYRADDPAWAALSASCRAGPVQIGALEIAPLRWPPAATVSSALAEH